MITPDITSGSGQSPLLHERLREELPGFDPTSELIPEVGFMIVAVDGSPTCAEVIHFEGWHSDSIRHEGDGSEPANMIVSVPQQWNTQIIIKPKDTPGDSGRREIPLTSEGVRAELDGSPISEGLRFPYRLRNGVDSLGAQYFCRVVTNMTEVRTVLEAVLSGGLKLTDEDRDRILAVALPEMYKLQVDYLTRALGRIAASRASMQEYIRELSTDIYNRDGRIAHLLATPGLEPMLRERFEAYLAQDEAAS